MRLAISNIAWPAGEDAAVASLLHAYGVEGVELALTKIWPEPLAASAAEVRAYRDGWQRQGIRIAALQALLFGKPQLTLFEGEAQRRQTLDYLIGMIERAGQLGAHALVFGSPKNRQRGPRRMAEAWDIAIPFFRELGRMAHQNGVYFCLEPNPPEYGCDFVTCAAEGIELVKAVAEEGFALHVDTAALTLAGDSPATSIVAAMKHCRHFHVSEPFLAEVGSAKVPHGECAHALHDNGYAGWVSIEMGEAKEVGAWRASIERSLAFVQRTYIEGGSHGRA